MTNIKVSINPQFHQELYEDYYKSTSYTGDYDYLGGLKITPVTNYSYVGDNLTTYYTIEGSLTFTTDQTIKYIYFKVLVYNRVKDVVGEVNYSFMGPFNGSGTLNLFRRFGEGSSNGTIAYMGITFVSCDYMDGTSGDAQLDIFKSVEILKVETPRDRKAKEKPERDVIKNLIVINLIFTPIPGLIYSLYKLIQGYTLAAKTYFKITGVYFAVYIVLFIAGNIYRALSG